MRSTPFSSDEQNTEPLQQPLQAKKTLSDQIPSNSDDIFLLSFSLNNLQQTIQRLLIPEGYDIGPVIWEDAESEVVAHLDKLRFAIKPGLILFEITLEADGTGLVPMIVPFKIGHDVNSASLIISTERLPRGEPLMTHRWGEIVQEHLWFALLEAGERLKSAKFANTAIQISGIYTDGKKISYLYSEPVTVNEIESYAKDIKAGKIPPKDEAPPLKPVELERPSTDPDDGSPFDDGDPSNDLPPNFSQLWREWGALFKQTTRFAKKLAWAAADLSKKLKKK